MEFLQVDVFTASAYAGNSLAVFPEAADLSRSQMQSIASEMNLSETTFVVRAGREDYELRIFTPAEELPFAGHPTIGTAWVLKHLGRISGDEVVQLSAAGATSVTQRGEHLWFSRTGEVSHNLASGDAGADAVLAKAIGVRDGAIGLEARELGRSGMLRPAYADAGVRQLMVPVATVGALAAAVPNPQLLAQLGAAGAYCFTALGAGRVRARGFFPGTGVAEDPATGSAAAALGLYLADRLGDIQFEIVQGVEMNRPSLIAVRAAGATVEVGGRCRLVLTGRLDELPSA